MRVEHKLEVPWTSSQRASQRRDQCQHFQHHLSVARQRWCQNLLYPCLSLQVESLGQVHDILLEQQASPKAKAQSEPLGNYKSGNTIN